MRMARPADPSFIGVAGVTTPLRKRARVRTRPVAGLFQAAPVTYIDRFFEFLVPDFHHATPTEARSLSLPPGSPSQ